MYVEEKTSPYARIAEGLDFIVLVLLGLVLNALLGAWLLLRGLRGCGRARRVCGLHHQPVFTFTQVNGDS